MGLFNRKTAPAVGPRYRFNLLPAGTRGLAVQVAEWVKQTPELVAHCEDVLERANRLNDVMATLLDNEAAFLRHHADNTRHTLTEDGKGLLYAASGSQLLRERIGLTRQGHMEVNPAWEAARMLPITSMVTIRALLKNRETAARAVPRPGRPRTVRERVSRALLGDVYGHLPADAAADPIFADFYQWEKPDAIATVLDQAEELHAARQKVEAAVAELHAQLEERRAELTQYELLDEVGRQAVNTELTLALSHLDSPEHRAEVRYTQQVTLALRTGIAAAS